jgi:hypothetical protein
MRSEIGFKEVMTYKRSLTKIDSNEAITVPSLWLKVDEMGYWQPTLERLARNDKLTRFRIRRQLDRFQGNDITIFLTDEIASSRVDDSHMGFERRRKLSKWQFGTKILLGNVIASRNHHKKNLMMITRLRVGASLLEAP